MKKVRFKKEYCADKGNRISYELVSDEIVDYCDEGGDWDECYNLKLLGHIPITKLEEADGTEEEGIDLFVRLSNM